jgi:hypothetical protein
VQATIRGLQARVDQMLDRAVDWIRRQAASLASRALGGDPNAPPQQRLENGLREGAQAVNRLSGTRIGLALINPVLAAVRLRNNMRTLEAQPRGTRWAVVGEVNPRGEQLTEKLVETGAAVGNFRTTITYHAINDLGFGTHMVADPVGPGHPAGSTVSQTLRLELREDRGSRTGLGSIAARQGRYRLGHLLNHHIGGPGNDWRNLTPITPSANTAHLNAVERNVKTLVLTHNRWVRYEVTADYSGSAPPVTGNVNMLESRFARLLRWSYQLKKPSDSNPNQLVDDPQSVAAIPASGSNVVPSISSSYAP